MGKLILGYWKKVGLCSSLTFALYNPLIDWGLIEPPPHIAKFVYWATHKPFPKGLCQLVQIWLEHCKKVVQLLKTVCTDPQLANIL